MAKRSWPAVYALLLKAISESEPYDVDGGIVLLHSIAGNAEIGPLACARTANLCHLTAIMSDASERRHAARRSMVRVASELERLSRQKA